MTGRRGIQTVYSAAYHSIRSPTKPGGCRTVLTKASIDPAAVRANDGTVHAQICTARIASGPARWPFAHSAGIGMPALLGGFLKNMHSPIFLVVAGYIPLRSLELALRPQDAFRTRAAHRLMTISAVGLLLLSGLFMLPEILATVARIGLPWPPNFL